MLSLPGVLTDSQLRSRVPSAFAETPWHGMSDRYAYVPTSDIITRLGREGFHPIRADQAKTRIPGKSDYTLHSLVFRHQDSLMIDRTLGTEIFEIHLTNSHDGASRYILDPGIFRLVCLNGAVAKSADFGSFSVRHSGQIADQVIDATFEVLSVKPIVMGRIDEWRSIQLDRPKQLALATAAVELRYDSTDTDRQSHLDPAKLLTVNRSADAPNDLWTTFNRIQENVTRGGLRMDTTNGRRARSRPIKSVAEDLRLNRSLWMLTEHMAKLMA